VAAEFAFVTVDRATIDRAAEEGDGGARGLQSALRSLSTQLSAAQLGITVTNLLIGYLAEPAVASLIDGPLESLGFSPDASEGIALILAIALATGVTMVFGELVPKNLAIANPLGTARAVQRFMRLFTGATRPIIVFFNGTANAILRRLGVTPQEELASARSPDELASLVRRSGQQGTLSETTATLVERSLAFGDRQAEDVMTPRGRVRTLAVDEPVIQVFHVARDSGRSRFPVMADGGERVAGIVHVKHVMAVPPDRRGSVAVGDVMADAVVVPSTLELDPLLATLRGGGLQMGIVVDEWGNFDGIVTLEDLVEEIVGDVRDEHDARDDSVLREGERRWDLSALLRPDEIAAKTGVELPEDEDYETVAGLLSVLLERVPGVGDRAELRVPGDLVATLSVLRMDGLRVDRVRLEVAAAPEPPPAGEEDGAA
jgi:CBS domain containing-hemolysin-like protein